jgi:hypothetical protein
VTRSSRIWFFGFATLACLVGVLTWILTGSGEVSDVARPPKIKATTASTPPVTVTPQQPLVNPRAIDPEIQKQADRLANRSETPLADLEIVHDFFELYRKTFGNQPVGSNEDLTAILTGMNPQNGILFPKDSPMIVGGELVDRWGTPYWLHPNSDARVEIRSAGPDRNLFTPDDLMLNASPGGLGVTPLAAQ